MVQVAQRPTNVHPQIVQSVNSQMMTSQQHQPQQIDSRNSQIIHHQPAMIVQHNDPTYRLNHLHAEREAALERERQERTLLEKEKEELRKQREELEAKISRSNATEQQVMEWKQQLVAKENELSAKEMNQQTALQERQKLQEQK